jgi:hypothetical protein
MTLILDNITLPEKGRVEVNLSFEIKVTAEEAQGKVTRWLRDEVSMLIYEEKPDLVFRQHPLWLVPAVIAFPSTGPAGNVGAIEVDAETGEMNNSLECKTEIETRADGIAKNFLPSS